MPETPNNKETIEAPPANAVEHNNDVAAKLAAQDISGQSTAPSDGSASSALDALMKEAEKKAEKAKPEAKPEAKPDVKPEGKSEIKSEVKPEVKSEVKPEVKPDAKPDATPSKDDAAIKRAEEIFKDSPALPAGASPKSSEAFSAVKIRAAQEISRLEQKIQEQTKTLSEQAEKLKSPIPSEVINELEDLRKFRARLDIDLDPKFKEFDKSVTSAQEFIYAQLKKSPAITEDVIAQIKKYGGPENVNLEKIFEAIKDPTIQRLVESKVADIEQQKFNKEQAIKSAKDNISQYLSEREKVFKESVGSHTKATKSELDKLVAELPWFKEQTPAAGADESAVKATKQHNEFVSTTRKQLDDALNDDSPQMRAIMLVGMAQLFNLQNVHSALKAEFDSVKKELEESKALVERLKAPSRLPPSEAPIGKPEPIKSKSDFTTPTGIALDKIRDQVAEARSKANTGG